MPQLLLCVISLIHVSDSAPTPFFVYAPSNTTCAAWTYATQYNNPGTDGIPATCGVPSCTLSGSLWVHSVINSTGLFSTRYFGANCTGEIAPVYQESGCRGSSTSGTITKCLDAATLPVYITQYINADCTGANFVTYFQASTFNNSVFMLKGGEKYYDDEGIIVTILYISEYIYIAHHLHTHSCMLDTRNLVNIQPCNRRC